MAKVKKALGTLQFVEKDQPINVNVKTHKVVFTVTDKSQFDLQKVQEALKSEGYEKVTLLSGPS